MYQIVAFVHDYVPAPGQQADGVRVRLAKQLSVVQFPMLGIERVVRPHVPGKIAEKLNRLAGDKVLRARALKEGQRKQGRVTVEEKDQAVALHHRITALSCVRRDISLAGICVHSPFTAYSQW